MRALSRKKANRSSLLRNLATSLVLYERIKTTTPKAKELRPIIERLMSVAQKNDLTARRRMLQYFFDEKAVKKTFEVLVPRFKNIKSGFIKTYKIGPRLGDGADMTIVEFVKGEIKEEKVVDIKEKDANTKESKTSKTAGLAKTTKTSAKAGK